MGSCVVCDRALLNPVVRVAATIGVFGRAEVVIGVFVPCAEEVFIDTHCKDCGLGGLNGGLRLVDHDSGFDKTISHWNDLPCHTPFSTVGAVSLFAHS